MKKIILHSKTHGQKTVFVDDEDYEKLSKFKWSVTRGYSARQLSRKNGAKPRKILMHRLIMGVLDDFTKHIDHIDGNGFNNQKSNLRLCTHKQNMCNQTKRRNGTSKFKGVYFDKSRNKWVSMIRFEGRSRSLGRFNCETKAAIRYNEEAKILHGEFANLNII